MVKDFHPISSKKVEWQTITPNKKVDWINQRDGIFSSFIALQLEKKKDLKVQSFFSIYSSGVITNRESWAFNSSLRSLKRNVFNSLNFYNQERMRYLDFIFSGQKTKPQLFVVSSPTKIKWDTSLYTLIENNAELKVDNSCFVQSMYRPYFKQHLYFNKDYNWSRYLQPLLFPTSQYSNIVICVNGTGTKKDFSVLISNVIFDRQTLANNQCFPLYWYEENKNPQTSLFDDAEANRYIYRDGITDWILKEVRNRFGGTKAITKEHIFYYVYGLLHSKQYRERFADDLKKSLPRIPIVDNVQDFMAFYKAGKELADLHLNYEQGINIPATEQGAVAYSEMSAQAQRTLGVIVTGDIDIWQDEWTEETYQYFAVEKMRFAKVRDENGKLIADKTHIICNGHITIENIPLKAYEYIVNGKSAIERIMERYALTIGKASQIKNTPNDWSRKHKQPRYILDLLYSAIIFSCKTIDIVNSLPILHI